jgi:hypothetical protein
LQFPHCHQRTQPEPSDNPIPKEIRRRFTVRRVWSVTRFFTAKLGPDAALEIDTEDILRHIGGNEPFAKGFALLESDVELDVVAVYTVSDREGRVVSFQTERVAPRR